jgi:hypothetical protein
MLAFSLVLLSTVALAAAQSDDAQLVSAAVTHLRQLDSTSPFVLEVTRNGAYDSTLTAAASKNFGVRPSRAANVLTCSPGRRCELRGIGMLIFVRVLQKSADKAVVQVGAWRTPTGKVDSPGHVFEYAERVELVRQSGAWKVSRILAVEIT